MASRPDCLFCRLVGEGKHVNAAEGFVAIEDINPKAPVHLLVLPERHIDTFLAEREAWLRRHLASQARDRAEIVARG